MQTQVKERGEKFTGEEVRAILAGRKSMFRRVVKDQPDQFVKGEPYWNVGGFRLLSSASNRLKCPYEPGMRLWVRETFIIESFGAGVAQIRYVADNARGNNAGVSDRKLPDRCGKVSSMRMPRHCSRITLEVTDVRCERLQSISEKDAKAEGVDGECIVDQHFPGDLIPWLYRPNFMQLWDSINAKRGYSWDNDPLVWCISFKRLENSNA